jgi:hypothetical protein
MPLLRQSGKQNFLSQQLTEFAVVIYYTIVFHPTGMFCDLALPNAALTAERQTKLPITTAYRVCCCDLLYHSFSPNRNVLWFGFAKCRSYGREANKTSCHNSLQSLLL